MRWLVVSVFLFSLCLSQVADAQTFPQASIAVRAGYYLLPNWSKTYDVIYGNNGETMLGAKIALRFTNRWEVGLTADLVEGKGERVWPDGSNGWDKTGEEISFELLPITIQLCRYLSFESPMTPYFGLGLGYCSFKETEGSSKSGLGFLALVGIEWSLSNSLCLLLESEYSSYPDIIGTGDLSHYYNEKDIGGLSLRLSARYSFSLGV
ncbi:MAG: outer membrane beta-barrel protein [bacterium]